MAIRQADILPITVLAGHFRTPVVIHRETWYGHVAERHATIVPYLDLVISTIEQPEIIARDARHHQRVYFYKSWPDIPDSPTEWTEVMVLLPADGSSGKLISAWPARKIGRKEILWTDRSQN